MNLQGLFTLVFRQPGKEKRGNQNIVIREKEWTKYEVPPRHAPQIRVHRPWESLETCKSFSHLSLHSHEEDKLAEVRGRGNQRIMTGNQISAGINFGFKALGEVSSLSIVISI